MRLDRNFYIRPTKKVAEDLLGKTIVRKLESKIFKKGKIVELEIYKGPEGKAAHSKNGKKTKRNKVFWEKGGLLYVYLIYGIHWMVNIITEKEGGPEAILIRAI